jgi:acyl-CoA hydrolase/RimJ/RimL family protein N-acetyltransferase
MPSRDRIGNIEKLKEAYPGKFAPEEKIFGEIRPGHRIFISTGCGEPQYLVNALIEYVEAHPKAFFDAEVFHVWTLGVAPYAGEKFKRNFRHNSFFVADNSREAVNKGLADYTPVFLSQVPDLLHRKVVPVNVALIQVTPPDEHGYMSLGVSVDITKAAVENASLVIAQVNPRMPRIHGDTFVHVRDVTYIVPRDEPLLEYSVRVEDETTERIGKYVARIVHDGETIQVGYGGIPNVVLANMRDKKHLGVHTELISDGIVELMKLGVIDNSRKTIDRGKAVASFCMGSRETYEFLHDNPGVEFRQIDYTNSPLVIARNRNMTAINSALQIDLTGQATAESIGRTFYSGIGGSADFMRGAIMSPGGKTILVLQSTARRGEVSRIVPFLTEGAGVTIGRGDIHYVVTEYGIAYLHGKNIRERAMDLIAIAHPKFREHLLEEARRLNLVYQDQKFICGECGEYPESLETYRTTSGGLHILLRPVKINDEPLLKDFFYSLSDKSIYKRFISSRKDMPHERLQDFTAVDYTKDMIILAILKEEEKETVLGLGQYGIDEPSHTAEVAFVTRDDYQNRGIGTELLSYLTYLARRQGLLGFTAEVLVGNTAMMHVFEKMGFSIKRMLEEGTYELKMSFRSK